MNHVIILAAGKGTRMKSELPKVLHPIKGVAMINRLLERVTPVSEKPTLIVGHKAEDVIRDTDNKYHYVLQKDQLGTGHAIMCAAPELKDKGYDTVTVLMGDQPLITTETLQELIDLQKASGATIAMNTVVVSDYEGVNNTFYHFGRVIRAADNTVEKIVEYKDATEEERACKEVNISYYCFDAKWLWQNINSLTNNNAAQEYYITDLVKIAKDQGKLVVANPLKNIVESYGINTPEQLKIVEEAISE